MKNAFTVKIDLEGQNITSKSLSTLADFLAKIHAFDRSSLENGTIDVDVEHIICPKLTGNIWEFTVEVHLKTDRSKLELIDSNKKEYIYKFLEKSRSIIVNNVLTLSDHNELLFALNELDKNAKELYEKIDIKFIPNKSRIFKNALDLSKINNIFNRFSFTYEYQNYDENSESKIIISNNMSEILSEQGSIDESESYDKNLIIVRPNTYNMLSKWDFKAAGSDNLSLYIKDLDWLKNLREKGEPNLSLVHYLHVTLKNGPVGRNGKIEPYIEKVNKAMKGFDAQLSLSLAS